MSRLGGEVNARLPPKRRERVTEAAVCPFCACLCDDLVISVDAEKNKITGVKNACKLGVAKFRSAAAGSAERTDERRIKKPRVDGEETDYEEAVQRAVEILRTAKKPLVYGLCNSGYEAQRVALKIAKLKRGVFDTSESVCHSLLYSALQKGRFPFHYALLDEIRENADVVVYWGANPVASHPRHLSKFSVYPVGRYAMRGVLDREVVCVEVVESELKKVSRWFLQVKPGGGEGEGDEGGDAKIAETLERLVKGEVGEPSRTSEPSELKELVKIADRLKRAFYGVIFVGLGVLASEGAAKKIEAILSLVETLNRAGVRFVLFPMKGHFNVTGAVQLLLRETGYPFGVDFSRGSQPPDKIFEPGRTTVLDVLKRGEVDAALVVGADPFSSFPKDAARRLCDCELPLILIDPFETPTTQFASVVLPTAITGVETGGIAYRMDGLPLRLEKVLDCDYPSDEETLKRILTGLKS
ncbi:MAG: formylmethanofuran dehydrogenase subunit B [Candidatus Methanophagaceae archaeon]|nr:MAG: formylmethanofuran dehydrogenase subunit B [Methanophagales archaeon]